MEYFPDDHFKEFHTHKWAETSNASTPPLFIKCTVCGAKAQRRRFDRYQVQVPYMDLSCKECQVLQFIE
jgi:hypothetical protein